MTETSFDFSGFGAELAEAQAALAAFVEGPVSTSTRDIGDAFEKAGERIARAMRRAGGDGAVSMRRLSKVILEELAKLALDQIFKGGAGLPFFGARAAGGAVTRGGSYLVGERGPELFTPAASGAITPTGGGGVQVHFHLGAGSDAQSIARHQGQIAAQVARAVAYGRRNL